MKHLLHGCMEIPSSLVQQRMAVVRGWDFTMQRKNHEAISRREAHYLS